MNEDPVLKELNAMSKGTMVEHLGITYTAYGKDWLEGTMPVDERTKQPIGLLHGGANVALAETLGSVAAHMFLDRTKQYAVGLEINANHVRAVRSGTVKGRAQALHIGKTTQIWEIKIVDEQEKLTCISRITMAVLDRK